MSAQTIDHPATPAQPVTPREWAEAWGCTIKEARQRLYKQWCAEREQRK